jgi:prepilin-type processing-associated H-X9-DG protein
MTGATRRSPMKVVLLAGSLTVALAAWVSAQQGDRAAITCVSNLRQLSTAMLMYNQDYDEMYPPAERWSPGILPYHKNTSILNCPADTGKPSYAMNRNLSMGSIAKVTRPADWILLFESNLHKPNAAGTKEAVANPPRHNGGNNWAYADGHVKWLKQGSAVDFGKKITPAPKPAKPGKPAKKPGRK